MAATRQPKSLDSRSHLLCFESQLNEDLLKLFVHKVNAELLKAVSLKGRGGVEEERDETESSSEISVP